MKKIYTWILLLIFIIAFLFIHTTNASSNELLQQRKALIKELTLKKRTIIKGNIKYENILINIDNILLKVSNNYEYLELINEKIEEKLNDLSLTNDTILLLEYIQLKTFIIQKNYEYHTLLQDIKTSEDINQTTSKNNKIQTENSNKNIPSASTSCTLNGQTIHHWESIVTYLNFFEKFGSTCNSQKRKCNNGTLAWSYTNTSCYVQNPQTCSISWTNLNHWESQFFYSHKNVDYNKTCNSVSQQLSCDNWTISPNVWNFIHNSCEVSQVEYITPIYVWILNPQDTNTWNDNSGNVIQWIARSDGKWFTSQDAWNGYILFNMLGDNLESLYDWQVSKDSHGDDLSVIKSGNYEYKLYTWHHEKKWFDVYTVNSDTWTKSLTQSYDILTWNNNVTASLNQAKDKVILRERIASNIDTLRIYSLNNIETWNIQHDIEFNIDRGNDNWWFQWIEYVWDKIIILTWDSSIDTLKYLYVFDDSGNELNKKIINLDLNVIRSEGIKYEPEALEYYNGDIYFSIMTGVNGNNKKNFYKVNLNNLLP